MYNTEKLKEYQKKKLEILIDVVKFCDKNWLDLETHLKTAKSEEYINDIDIAELKKDSVKKIECLGGMTNTNFLIETKDEKYVLRLPGEGTTFFIDRKNENFNTEAIQTLKIDSRIVYFNENTGVKISKYLENSESLIPNTAFKNIEKVSEVLKCLHNSNLKFKNNFNVFNEILRYEKEINGTIPNIYKNYLNVREKVLSLEKILKSMGEKLVPCHNDTVPENFILSKDKLYLIDWEYSGMNELEWDLGAFCLESKFSDEETKEFIRCYFGGLEKQENILKIKIYQICQDFLWTLWTILKEKKGENFGNYGIERYKRAIKGLEGLNYDLQK